MLCGLICTAASGDSNPKPHSPVMEILARNSSGSRPSAEQTACLGDSRATTQAYKFIKLVGSAKTTDVILKLD